MKIDCTDSDDNVCADIRSGSQDLCKFSLDFMPVPVYYVYTYLTLFSLSSSIVLFSEVIYQQPRRAVKCGTSGDVASGGAKCDPQEFLESAEKLRIFRRCYIVRILTNKANISIYYLVPYRLSTFPRTPKHVTQNGHFALNSVLRRYVWSSGAWLSKLGCS